MLVFCDVPSPGCTVPMMLSLWRRISFFGFLAAKGSTHLLNNGKFYLVPLSSSHVLQLSLPNSVIGWHPQVIVPLMLSISLLYVDMQ
jgi:hypothetical protein